MIAPGVYASLRARLARRRASRVQPPGRLLFVCQGRQGYRAGMGSGLYATEPVFRAMVQRLARPIEDRTGVGLVELFEADVPPLSERDDEFRSILSHGLVHLALIALWRSKGVVPDGVVGLSLGEITATFAAGMLSAEDAARVVETSAIQDTRVTAYGRLIVAFAGKARALELCRRAPIQIDIFAEFGPETMVLLCDSEDFDATVALLDAEGVGHHAFHHEYGYHTFRFRPRKEALMAELAPLRPHPPRVPFYSGMMGTRVPDWTCVDAAYWYWMLALPVWFNTAAEAALADGFETALHIGPNAALRGYVDAAAARGGWAIESLASLEEDAPEPDAFGRAFDRLAAIGLAARMAGGPVATPGKRAGVAAGQGMPEPSPTIDPRPPVAPVRHVERHGHWLVLGAEEVTQALAQPEIFTSAPAREIDPILVSVGPPDHGPRRTAFATALARRHPAMLATSERAVAALLEAAADAGTVDLMGSFALPVAQAAAAGAIGLRADELGKVVAIAAQDPFGLSYVPRLREQFLRLAKEPAAEDTLLAELVRGDGFRAPDAAAHLLTLAWVAGTTTTAAGVGAAAAVMLYSLPLRHEALERAELVPAIFDEALRLETPAQVLLRRTAAPVALGGVAIPAGGEVRLHLGAANRDPRVYANPDLFMLGRGVHLGFGGGIHQCVGAGIARTVARVAITALIARFPQMHPAIPHDRLRYVQSDHLRAPEALPAFLSR